MNKSNNTHKLEHISKTNRISKMNKIYRVSTLSKKGRIGKMDKAGKMRKIHRTKKKIISGFACASLISSVLINNVIAGAEPSGKLYEAAERAHTQQMIDETAKRTLKAFKERQRDCGRFNGRMVDDKTCEVRPELLYQCNKIISSCKQIIIKQACVNTYIDSRQYQAQSIRQKRVKKYVDSGKFIDYTVSQHVPEPSTILLMITGICFLITRKFK